MSLTFIINIFSSLTGILPPSLLVGSRCLEIISELLCWDRINGEPGIAPLTIGGLGRFLFLGCVV